MRSHAAQHSPSATAAASPKRRVLVLGGYGTFGSRIAERAAAKGFEVLVAGRSQAKAAEFCRGRDGLVPIALDRDRELGKTLKQHRPFAVVDAVGPFQGAGYETARAAMEAGSHYLDIADGTAFVCGIAGLDAQARTAGVSVISGASSVPALSGAVASRLAEGLTSISSVDLAISASSRGTAGRSVAAAILSYIGRPVRLYRGGRWSNARGWQELRSESFEVSSEPPLRRRLVAIADVPDLALLPARLPGHPSVTFSAGTDIALHNIGLWVLSWLVRAGVYRSPERHADAFAALQHRTRLGGSERSAFKMRLLGKAGSKRMERCWTIIANQRCGPEIPTLAVPLLLEKLAQGSLKAGACDAGTLLNFEDFHTCFAAMPTAHKVTERELPPSLHARWMREHFARLPSAVQAMHQVLGDSGANGEVEVKRGTNIITRLMASIVGFPPAGSHKLHVSFTERDGHEYWTRECSDRYRFSSHLFLRDGLLLERFMGVLSFGFDFTDADSKGFSMRLCKWWLGPIPMPRLLLPRCVAREWEEDGRFYLDVPVEMPFLGLLVHYRGWLQPTTPPYATGALKS